MSSFRLPFASASLFRRPSGIRPIAVGILAGATMAVLLGLAPAHAHNAFVSSSPAAASVVTEQPGTVVITTSDALLDSGPDSPTTYLQVRGPGSSELYYGDGCVTVDGASITMPVRLGEAGDYSVAWGVVSADGHPITSAGNGGDITFSWQPADGEKLVEGIPMPPSCGAAPPEPDSPAPGADEPAAAPPTDATAEPAEGTSTAAADILWIGAALGVLLVAAAIAFLVVRARGRFDDPGATGEDGSRGDPPAAP